MFNRPEKSACRSLRKNSGRHWEQVLDRKLGTVFDPNNWVPFLTPKLGPFFVSRIWDLMVAMDELQMVELQMAAMDELQMLGNASLATLGGRGSHHQTKAMAAPPRCNPGHHPCLGSLSRAPSLHPNTRFRAHTRAQEDASKPQGLSSTLSKSL